ncbi:MAG: hypothetical protein JWQ63_2060 [Mucilaginibacter sp.]|nr:hypothetical protein [Mucilaginibacter sp.]
MLSLSRDCARDFDLAIGKTMAIRSKDNSGTTRNTAAGFDQGELIVPL